jgi:nucleoid-associated protein YgaU
VPEKAAPSPTGPDTFYTVKPGDQISKIAGEVYGVWSPAVREWIKKHNPDLRDMNRIEVGMQLALPPLPAGVR